MCRWYSFLLAGFAARRAKNRQQKDGGYYFAKG
jgi:hypothetical protein